MATPSEASFVFVLRTRLTMTKKQVKDAALVYEEMFYVSSRYKCETSLATIYLHSLTTAQLTA